jgi:enoyl-[acyl-carrier protein] reductase/trans-2-enoyl-CoA reductase (NAD+)
LTAHPDGCEQNIKNQIEYVKSKGANGAKKVLVIGASTGFGLASRFQVLLDQMRLLLAYF